MPKIGIFEINRQVEQIPNCIRFDKGSGTFAFPEEFILLIDEVKKDVRGKYFPYPYVGGEEILLEEIAKFEARNGRQVDTDMVALTHGGISGLYTTLNLISKSGD